MLLHMLDSTLDSRTALGPTVLYYSEYIAMLVALRRLLFFAFLLIAVVLPAQRLIAAPRPMSAAPAPYRPRQP